MNSWIGYYFNKAYGKLIGNQYHQLNKWFRKRGVTFCGNGEEPIVCCNIAKNEPHLISIGSDTVISGNVEFITHDHSISRLGCGINNLFGRIEIGNNCFIGNGTTILYGVSIADNVIVAAGSVVTKSICESNVVYGGNPAKKLLTWNEFEEKYKGYILKKSDIPKTKANDSRLVKR